MAVTVDFIITKNGTESITVKDDNSGWGIPPSAKVVLTIRDKIFVDNILQDRSVEVVLYDPDATATDGIGTSVEDQINGVLFDQYLSEDGLPLTSTQLYGVDKFIDSFYQVSVESPAVDVIALTLPFYHTSEMETIGMKMLEFIDRPYDSNLMALKGVMPWHFADAAELAATKNDLDFFYVLLQFINRNYK